jgi:hypothetical protein
MMTRRIAPVVAATALLTLAAVAFTAIPGLGVASVAAAQKKGALTVAKNCDAYDFSAGSFCTITQSSLPELVGATVFYGQAANTPAGWLDSNVLIVARPGDWAVGRCTLDLSTFRGLCTFSDGAGQLAGFRGRVEVAQLTGLNFSWTGTYSFKSAGDPVR